MEASEVEDGGHHNNNTTPSTTSGGLGRTSSLNSKLDEDNNIICCLASSSKVYSQTKQEQHCDGENPCYESNDPHLSTGSPHSPPESYRPSSPNYHQLPHTEMLLLSTGKGSSTSNVRHQHHGHRSHHHPLDNSRHHHTLSSGHRRHNNRHKNNRSPNHQPLPQHYEEDLQLPASHGRRTGDNCLYNRSSRNYNNNMINTSCCSSSSSNSSVGACGASPMSNSNKISQRFLCSPPVTEYCTTSHVYRADTTSPPPPWKLPPSPSSPMTDVLAEEHVHCLFPELLVMIFCYLDVRDKGRVAQVCNRWRDAAYSRTVWRGVEAKIHLRRSNPSLFRSLAKRGIRRIQILSLKRSLRDVVAGIPDLESLNLSGCYNITDAGLGQALLHRLPSVSELNLSLCKQITDYSLSRIAIYLKNLKVLHLGGCSVITNAGLFVISYGLIKLKSLDLRSCRDLSDQGIAHLAGLGDELTTQGNLALEHLCLQDCQKLTDQALHYMSLGLKNLSKVNLSFCGGVTDTGLQYLAKMPSLREINLASCDYVTDTGLSHLARGGSHITSLDVSFCDKIGDWGLSCLAEGLFNLECLSLSACNISDNGISHIAQSMHGLTTLNIGQCHRITDRGLNLIADNLKKLSRMDLYGCTQISAKGLERIMQLPSLSSLNLGLWHKR